MLNLTEREKDYQEKKITKFNASWFPKVFNFWTLFHNFKIGKAIILRKKRSSEHIQNLDNLRKKSQLQTLTILLTCF